MIFAPILHPADKRAYLAGVTSVEITCAQGPPIEARLIGAWIVAQLGSDYRRVIFNESRDAKSPVERVRIESEIDGRRGVFSVGTANGGLYIESDAPDIPKLRGTVVLGPDSQAESLLRILDAPDREWVYERTISTLRSALGAGKA